uniref:Cnn_1N domain-containing protein n=1 Tax=Strongyloides venezuelensis TaxID=75913 RepID=A0A0K0EVL3_STRVS
MVSEYSISEIEDNLCSKIYGSRLEDLEYEYYLNTLLADNEITNDLMIDHVNFNFERDGNNMPKALKAIESLKKQNHNLRSRLMILTRDVPFMKALTSDQKVKLIIKLRLHLEKLIKKCNQLSKYKKDDQISNINSIEKLFLKDGSICSNIKEEIKDCNRNGSLSLHINSQAERLLIENKHLRDKIEKLEKKIHDDECGNQTKSRDVMLVKTELNIKIEDDKKNSTFHNVSRDDNAINELKYHLDEMKKYYNDVICKHLTAVKILKNKEERIFELEGQLNNYKNFKNM